MTRTAITLALVTLFAITACRDPMPCPDCDIAEDDENDPPPPDMPDLPCNGADLMTDNLNCGTCGNQCLLYFDGTQYEAGMCKAGVCGPSWSSCVHEGFGLSTCAEVCAALGQECVPSGCSGYTGLLFGVLFGEGCNANWYTPEATMTGGCSEPIPWTPTGDDPRHVMCCCSL